MSSFYAVLGVESNASLDEIRERYRLLVVQLHPDKSRSKSSSAFDALQVAWHTLRDAPRRAQYDASLREQSMLATPISVVADVDLDDMQFDEPTRQFQFDCRCGDRFVVTEDELDHGIDTVSCRACSLAIRILYERANDDA